MEEVPRVLTYVKRQIRRGTFAAVTVKAAAAIVSFFTQVILTRYLGVETYGHYIYVMTWVNLCVLLGKQGFTTASIRFIPEYHSRNQYGILNGFLVHARRRVFIGASLLGIALMASAYVLVVANEALFYTFLTGGIAVPFLAYLHLRSSEIRAFKDVIRATIPPEVMNQVLLIAGVIVFVGSGILTSSAANAMVIHVASTVLMIGLSIIFFHQISPSELSAAQTAPKRAKWNYTARFMLLTAAFNLLLAQADILMVGAIIGTTEAGIYAVASKLATLVIFIAIAINIIFGPVVADLYQSGEYRLLSQITKYVMIVTASVAVLVAVVLAAFPNWFLSLFGPEFVQGRVALLLLVGAQLVNAIFGPVTLMLNMTNNQKLAAYILTVSAIFNIVLNGLLIAFMGTLGAAVATLISMVIWNIWGCLAVRKRIGILTMSYLTRSAY